MEANREKRRSQHLISLFNEFYSYYLKVINWNRKRYQPSFAFIRFNTVGDMEELL